MDFSSFTNLSLFLPYMSEEDIGELAMLALEKDIPVNKFLDYMNEEDVTKLALKALKFRKNKINPIFPINSGLDTHLLSVGNTFFLCVCYSFVVK